MLELMLARTESDRDVEGNSKSSTVSGDVGCSATGRSLKFAGTGNTSPWESEIALESESLLRKAI